MDEQTFAEQMDRRRSPVWTPPSGPPRTDRVPPAVYEAMGVEGVERMFEAFYRRLSESGVRRLFPTDDQALLQASRRSAALFVFLFGGPPLYQQRYGPPRMRMRHLPFEIDAAARSEWLRCFRETLDESARYGMPEEHVEDVWRFVEAFSAWMVNKE